MARLDFARSLAVDVLNRARVIELAYKEVEEVGSDDATALLFVALEHFGEDCEEARRRGRRLRLCASGLDGRNWLDKDSIETDENLAKIGGALVPLDEYYGEVCSKAEGDEEDDDETARTVEPVIAEHIADKLRAFRHFAEELYTEAGMDDVTLHQLRDAIDSAEISLRS
jgi:hypothetical protein